MPTTTTKVRDANTKTTTKVPDANNNNGKSVTCRNFTKTKTGKDTQTKA